MWIIEVQFCAPILKTIEITKTWKWVKNLKFILKEILNVEF